MFFLNNNRKWADTLYLPISLGSMSYLLFPVLPVMLSGQLSLSLLAVLPNGCLNTIGFFLNSLHPPDSASLRVCAPFCSLLFGEFTPLLLVRIDNHNLLYYSVESFLNVIRYLFHSINIFLRQPLSNLSNERHLFKSSIIHSRIKLWDAHDPVFGLWLNHFSREYRTVCWIRLCN